jgi:uncharacterized repeat protein (TIGR03837 family)
MLKRWDIFCKIVDNFGDIGVCWRLARQLQVEHGLQVRLWIDDLATAKNLIPDLDLEKNSQICEQITILKWDENADFSHAAEVVIEAFACELLPSYLAAMSRQQSKWVNLEYLSAETWVDDFHAKPSPQANGLIRHFYFPGFTEKTGGLIRESNLLTRHSNESRNLVTLTTLDSDFRRNDDSDLKISLFCYPHAPIHALLDAFVESKKIINCYIPTSSILPKIADYFGKNSVNVGDVLTQKNLMIHILPFLSQADYDKLLCDCDLNFVRGEDSWVRAIWAGKPFIWQPYWQDENTHVLKLKAFIDLYYKNYEKSFEQKEMLWKANGYWLSEHQNKMSSKSDFKTHILALINNLENWQIFTQKRAQNLAQQNDLARKLVVFCNKL